MANKTSYDIKMSRQLLTFLQDTEQADANRFTKLDAFIHLLESAADESGEVKISGDSMPLSKGQLVSSFSELAEVWNWHRGNVRMFIQSLINLGAVTTERVSKKLIITLPLLFEGEASPVRLLDREERGLLRFILGISSVDEFFDFFERAMNEAESSLSESPSDTEIPERSAMAIGNRLRKILDHFVLHASDFATGTPELHEALHHMFAVECNCDLMLFFSLLSFGGISNIMESTGDTTPVQLSDEARNNLRIIVRHYSKWFRHEKSSAEPDIPPGSD